MPQCVHTLLVCVDVSGSAEEVNWGCVYKENLCAFVNGDSLIAGHMLFKVVLSACLVIITCCSVSFMILDEIEMYGCTIQKLFNTLCHRGFLSETRYNDFTVWIFREELKSIVCIYIDEMCAIAVCCVFVRLRMDLDWYLRNASSLSKCHSLVNICYSSFTMLSAGVYCIVVAEHMQALTCMFVYGKHNQLVVER